MNTKDTFTVIPDWILDQPLDIWETIVFSVIWGFTQDGETVFHGSRAFLARKAKCSTDKVDKCTKKLVALGLIEKSEKYVNGIKFCEYWAKTAGSRCERPVAVGGGDVAVVGGMGSRCERHNNIVNNIDNNIDRERGRSPRFVPPTLEEVKAYCAERHNSLNAQKFIDYYEANGWMVGKNKMKDWRAAVRNWESHETERRNGTARNIDKGSPAAYRIIPPDEDWGESTI